MNDFIPSEEAMTRPSRWALEVDHLLNPGRINDRGETIEQPGVTVTISVNVRLPYHGRLMYRAASLCCRLAGWFANRATQTIRFTPSPAHLAGPCKVKRGNK